MKLKTHAIHAFDCPDAAVDCTGRPAAISLDHHDTARRFQICMAAIATRLGAPNRQGGRP